MESNVRRSSETSMEGLFLLLFQLNTISHTSEDVIPEASK